MFVLEVRNLRYAYPDGTPALEGVNLALEPGEKTALVGANGSGKSTLLLHLTGCLGPDSGEILQDGRPLGDDVDRARRMVGMMFQEPDDQLFMPSVLEDVAFAPRASGTPPREAAEKAAEMLERLGISHLASRPPHRLSGGEKRMVALAGILVSDPEVLVLDEPSASLDPRSRRMIIATLQCMKLPMILATHDLDMAMDVCSTATILAHGKSVLRGALPELFHREETLERWGLELPLSIRPGESSEERREGEKTILSA